jgi:Flp pilus assembly pilin Flp
MRALRQLSTWTSVEDGQDLLEYGLLVSLIALFAMAAVGLIGDHMIKVFWTAIGPGI